jgi:hypothetical protein
MNKDYESDDSDNSDWNLENYSKLNSQTIETNARVKKPKEHDPYSNPFSTKNTMKSHDNVSEGKGGPRTV